MGIAVDTVEMRVCVSDCKDGLVRRIVSTIILRASSNRRVVSLEILRFVCDVCMSLSMAVSLS